MRPAAEGAFGTSGKPGRTSSALEDGDLRTTRKRKYCGDCKAWQATGIEDSGFLLSDGSGDQWRYAIGVCTHPRWAGTVHGRGLPDWILGCEHWRKAPKAKAGVN